MKKWKPFLRTENVHSGGKKFMETGMVSGEDEGHSCLVYILVYGYDHPCFSSEDYLHTYIDIASPLLYST